jgi:hypothetical protein
LPHKIGVAATKKFYEAPKISCVLITGLVSFKRVDASVRKDWLARKSQHTLFEEPIDLAQLTGHQHMGGL